MKDLPRPLKLIAPALPGLVGLVVPLAGILAFFAAPMLGKRLTPIDGGTAGTWLGSVVYLQLAVLLGYSWAAWLNRKTITFQVAATAALGIVAVLTFRLPSSEAAASASLIRVVWRLAFSSLPALVLLFSATPLVHTWLRRRGEEIPYYVLVLASVGSLAVVLLYPFVFEPNLSLSDQSFYWQGFLLIVAGSLAAIGYIIQYSNDGKPAVASPVKAPSIGPTVLGLWLSALTCIGLLGATYLFIAEIGSVPMAWVGPLGAYLLSLMIVFSGRWRRWMTLGTIVWLAVSLTGFMVTKGFTAVTVNYTTAWWLFSLTASGSFLANAILSSVHPTGRNETFYLTLAAGGLIGALLSSAVLPLIFSQPVEFTLAYGALLTTGLLWLVGRRDIATVAVTAGVLLVPILGLGLQQSRQAALGDAHLMRLRDSYGYAMVKTDARSVVYSSDSTTRATQLLFDEPARHHPTLYYTESTAVGRVLQKLQAARPQLAVGVAGAGAGTLAAYARPADTFDFWDLDPKALRVAKENFTYIADSAGHINLLQRDGRNALEASKTDYDVIVIDLTTGSGVPAHFLTREAMQVYQARLAARNGLLVVATSSRYFKLFPVLEATARSLGRAALEVTTDVSASTAQQDWDAAHNEYTVIGRPDQVTAVQTWFAATEDNDRVKHTLHVVDSPLLHRQLVWTDDRNAALDALELGRFLFEP